MATKERIEIDFRMANQQADKIENIANELEHLSKKKYEGMLQNIAANWKGENASMYLGKGQKLQTDMILTANELREIAAEIRRVAKRLYDADMNALARVRGHGGGGGSSW